MLIILKSLVCGLNKITQKKMMFTLYNKHDKLYLLSFFIY